MDISAKVRSTASGHEARVQTGESARDLTIPARPGGGSGVNGGELLTLALATCYCNDIYREAGRFGVAVEAVEVEASARFGAPGAPGTDVRYTARIESRSPPEKVAELLRYTDTVAEIQNTLRAGAKVAFEADAVARAAAQPPTGEVTLREITKDTARDVIRLTVGADQLGFVATNAVSLAQALFHPEAWYRAAYKGETLVGFVMVSDEKDAQPPKEKPEIGLWRLMVDQRYQRLGIGRDIVMRVADHARSRGYDKLHVSWVPAPGGPEPFYRGLGFVPTGDVDHGEVVAALELGPGPSPR